jgi:hypothetical protein
MKTRGSRQGVGGALGVMFRMCGRDRGERERDGDECLHRFISSCGSAATCRYGGRHLALNSLVHDRRRPVASNRATRAATDATAR